MPQNSDIKNPNHPQKGSTTEVDPIRSEKDIKSIKQLLENYSRDYLLFVLGINNGIRVGDLLKLRVGDLRYLKPGQVHQIKESKTGKKISSSLTSLYARLWINILLPANVMNEIIYLKVLKEKTNRYRLIMLTSL